MKFRVLLILAAAVFSLTACVIEPFDGDGRGHYHGDHDYGHRVWRE